MSTGSGKSLSVSLLFNEMFHSNKNMSHAVVRRKYEKTCIADYLYNFLNN